MLHDNRFPKTSGFVGSVSKEANETKIKASFVSKRNTFSWTNSPIMSKSTHSINNILLWELAFSESSNYNEVVSETKAMCLPQREFSSCIKLHFTAYVVLVSHLMDSQPNSCRKAMLINSVSSCGFNLKVSISLLILVIFNMY